MAWPKGKPRPPGAGRKAGTPNKKTDLFAICESLGVNVFEEMVRLAAEEPDPKERFFKLKEVAPYLYARKRETTNLTDRTAEELLEAAEQVINDPEQKT